MLEAHCKGDYIYEHKSGDSEMFNNEQKVKRRGRYIKQRRFLRRSNKARKRQQCTTTWRESQAERAFKRQHVTFDREREEFW